MASGRVLNRLSAKRVATVPPGTYVDGGGLQLNVDPTGARRWILRVSIGGRRVARGLEGR